MPKKPVVIGELLFSTKKEATSYFTKILNKYPLATAIHGKEFDDVIALLLCHPRASEKIGSGIKSIKVDQGFNRSNRCFHVVRVDDSVEDFSIAKCIDGDHSPFYKFCIACRKSVETELRARKEKYFKEEGDKESKVVCPITKEKITFEESHLDHREPFTFSVIVHFFIQANGIDLNSVEYVTECKYGNELKNHEIADKFRDWHRENAILRIVKGKANLAKSYLGRVSITKADLTLN